MIPFFRRCLPLLAVVAAVTLPATARAQSCLAGTAADEFTADRVGLVREWIVQIPYVANGSSLAEVVIGDGLVVAQTSDGTVHAIQSAPFPGRPASPIGMALPGSLLWSQRVGANDGPVIPAGVGADLVTVSRGRELQALERATGMPRWHRSLGHDAAAGPAVIGDWVYAPSESGAVIRYPINPLRQPAAVAGAAKPADASAGKTGGKKKPAKANAADQAKRKRKESLDPVDINAGGPVHMAPMQFAEGVLWCTSSGLLVALEPTDLEWRRREFSLENPPAGPVATRGRSIFAATVTGDLARIDLPESLKDLYLVWNAILPGPAESGPFLAGDSVVVSLGVLGTAAYSAETGDLLWHVCTVGSIRAVNGNRVWLVDEVGRLASLDIADGSRREIVCLGPFTLPVINGQSDRLLLASPGGTIVSLAPRASRATGTPTAADDASDPAAPAREPSDSAATPQP